MAAMTIFERLGRGQPTPVEEKKPDVDAAQLLLNWISRRPGTTITQREIRNHGPRPIRNKEIAISAAKVLAAHGHLAPLAANKWQIIRQPLIPRP
jgi:hypothetical protein